MTLARRYAMIPAAGVGARMGSVMPKQYLMLGDQPMLRHVLECFYAATTITHTYLVVNEEDAFIDGLLTVAPYLSDRITLLRCGGSTRQQSVLNGLLAVREAVHDLDWMLVHDAARPGLSVALIDKLIAAVGDDPVGGLLALPVADTLKRADGNRVTQTVARTNLWAAQTPQMFRYGVLLRALHQAAEVTDEASAIEALGLQPLLVEGSTANFKVTLPEDVALATRLLKGSS